MKNPFCPLIPDLLSTSLTHLNWHIHFKAREKWTHRICLLVKQPWVPHWPPCFLELKCLEGIIKAKHALKKNASCYKTYSSPTKRPTFYWRHRPTYLLLKYRGTYTSKSIISEKDSHFGVLDLGTEQLLLCHTVLDILHANCSWLINTNCMTKKFSYLYNHITHFW